MERAHLLLNRAWTAYDEGQPFMTDSEFDALAHKYKYEHFGSESTTKKYNHMYPMQSLKKVFDEDTPPYTLKNPIETPKLDGTAISISYIDGHLAQALRRGRDGLEGEDVTQQILLLVPATCSRQDSHQINGEVVCGKDIENARNYASGAFGLKDMEEFVERSLNLQFIAYSVYPVYADTYTDDMMYLESTENSLATVLTPDLTDMFRTDGVVFRENDNELFEEAGRTSKHPRGAYARKLSSDVAILETTLTAVIWQVGRTGKVSPVAIFDEIVIDDARITRATLHNPRFIADMQLGLGDTILVTRSGGIIPKVLGKL